MSDTTAIDIAMPWLTYMFSSWPQNHLTMLSRYAARTCTMNHRWILSVTTDCPVFATASFRCCEFAGRLDLITSLSPIAVEALAGEVVAEFSPCLADTMSRTFVVTWLCNKRRIMRGMCIRLCLDIASCCLGKAATTSELCVRLKGLSTMCSLLRNDKQDESCFF